MLMTETLKVQQELKKKFSLSVPPSLPLYFKGLSVRIWYNF
jgi:hypothetical protein